MFKRNNKLPDDSIIEILSRLPVRSLLRFGHVCKSWYALVKNITFISKHLKNYNDDNTSLIVSYLDSDSNKYSWSIFLDGTLRDLSYEDFSHQMPVHGQIMGPYDGLFCLYKNDCITIWNPALKEFRTLPKCKTTPLPQYTSFFHSYVGFGLGLINNEYKLVLIRALWDHKKGESYSSHVAVYSFSSYYWRDFKGGAFICYCVKDSFGSTYLNGVYYWLTSRANENSLILSFHMSDEVFQEMQGPNFPTSARGALALYKDALSLLLLDTKENSFNIWVMNERYWSKELVVGPLSGVHSPLGIWKDGGFFYKIQHRPTTFV